MTSLPVISRHGLSLVYKPPSAAEGPTVAHIVFVHGLFGDPQATWTGKKRKGSSTSKNGEGAERMATDGAGRHAIGRSGSVFWPYELLRTAISNVNIHTWGYDADIDGFWSSASQNTVAQHAANLTSDIADLIESDGTDPLPIIFVVHSLGGLVVKAALNQSAATRGTRLSVVVEHVRGVMFLGTPHRGSQSASVGKYAYRITTVATKRPNLTLLRALERNSEALDGIGTTFLQTLAGHRGIQIYSFREEKAMRKFLFINQIIVAPDSAKIGLPEEEVSSIPADHSKMTKFGSPEDTGFKRVVAQLRRWVRKLMDEASVTIDDCLRSLESTDTQIRFNSVAPSHAKTFHWLYDRNKVSFSSWIERPKELGSIYWVQGKPGSGKSTLMKFAMLDPRTRIALEKHGGTKWIVAGYFFHDRGKLIQKSIQGMLQALLYAILCQSRGLLGIIQPIYEKMVSKQRTKLVTWDFEGLQSTFQMIVKQRTVKTRLCLFLDALDEHHGDNDRLSDMMHELAATVDNDVVQLRLCLASRPWDTFVNSFGNCPGFKIHEHTLKDIESYTSTHLHNALGKLTNPDEVIEAKRVRINRLADRVSRKAQGVFIWVRIVVELITAAVQSRTPFVALDAMLEEMPEELTELYIHTLQRIERKHAEESYVMLQLARCALTPLDLEAFVNATSWNIWGIVPDPAEEYLDDMIQRVTSRSGGLLEVIEVYTSNKPSNAELESDRKYESRADFDPALLKVADALDDTGVSVSTQRTKSYFIQFCHQTVKEFIQNAPVNFGLHRTNEGGNGYGYLLAAAIPGCKAWGKHMADEALEYAVLAYKDSTSIPLKDVRQTLTELFLTMDLKDMLTRKRLGFYVEQTLANVDSLVECLLFSSGLLEIVTYPATKLSSPSRDLWLTALIGPRSTSYRPSRKDMLQALWDYEQRDSLNSFTVDLYRPNWESPYGLRPLEIMILDRLLQLGGTEGLPAIEFLLSHGANPNLQWIIEPSKLLLQISTGGLFTPLDSKEFTIFTAIFHLDSAPLIRLFGNYGAEVPRIYWEPLRKIQGVIKGHSEVFREVMKIVDRQESLERKQAPHREASMRKRYFPAIRLEDDMKLAFLFQGIVGGVSIANGEMLYLGRAASSSLYMLVRKVVVIIRWLRKFKGSRRFR